MKRILLIPSPNVRGQQIAPYLPFGLFSLQAISSEFGDTVDVLHVAANLTESAFADSREMAETILTQAGLSKYDVVGLSTMCSSFHHSLMIARCVKERAPDTSVWMGGPHASELAEDVVQAFDDVDAVFVGESELTFSEVLARRSQGVSDLAGVAGVRTRQGGFTPRAPLSDLDRLPFIDRASGFLKAFHTTKPFFLPKRVPVEAARGCTGRCAFCSTRLFWGGRVRRKSDARLIAEMQRLHTATGIPHFIFIGDNFATPRERLLGFCRTMAREASDLRWVCNMRMDRIKPSDVDALWNGGCRGFFVGIESASQRTLDRICKGVALERELEVVRRAVARGFLVETSFIVGFPWETKEDLDRTFDLHCEMLECGVLGSQVVILCPLPGTRFADPSESRVRFDRGRSGIVGDDLPLDDEEVALIKKHPKLFMQFGYCETDHVSWADVSAVADASAYLSHAYASKWEGVSLPE